MKYLPILLLFLSGCGYEPGQCYSSNSGWYLAKIVEVSETRQGHALKYEFMDRAKNTVTVEEEVSSDYFFFKRDFHTSIECSVFDREIEKMKDRKDLEEIEQAISSLDYRIRDLEDATKRKHHGP